MTAYHPIYKKSNLRNVMRTGLGIHPTIRNKRIERNNLKISFLILILTI